MTDKKSTSRLLLGFTDYTYLDDDNDPNKYDTFIKQAAYIDVACLCVYPNRIAELNELLPDKRLATVLNFPTGQQSLTQITKDIELSKLAQEVDIVFPYKLYLNGQKEQAFEVMRKILRLLPKAKIIKVIIETGAFQTLSDLKKICQFLLTLPIHFIKTSTGKIHQGASIEAVQKILECIQGTGIGLKVSGGIKTQKQALEYFQLAEKTLKSPLNTNQFRIGTSKIF